MVRNRPQAEELSQLSRLLFDRTARLFWLSWILEALAGTMAAGLSVIGIQAGIGLLGAVIAATVLGLAYVLRLTSENQHDEAETMRRQSVFSEGLGWQISPWQYSRWVERAGTALLAKLDSRPRETDYYAASGENGPQKLAEMTLESAFYTRQIYGKLGWRLWFVIITLILVLLGLLTLAATRSVSESSSARISEAVFLTIPTILGLDLIGWMLRLGRLHHGIQEVERDLEDTLHIAPLDEGKVIRLVAEYNCLTVTGIPILKSLFNRWHKDISTQWRARSRLLGLDAGS